MILHTQPPTNPAYTANPATVDLSVVVIPLTGGASLTRCVEALAGQLPPERMEILVLTDGRLAIEDGLAQRHAALRLLHTGGPASYARQRAVGVGAARGRVVAITEDQCIPPPQWCENILTAHRANHVAIGGPMEKQQPDTLLGWAIYLREFTHYIPPVTEGPSHSLTDANVTYKREALQTITEVWAQEFHEPQVHNALKAQGHSLWLTPALCTRQQRTMKLGVAMAERHQFGRLFGSLRVAGVAGFKRLALIAGSLLLPAVLLGRVLLAVIRKKRYLGPCIAALPYLALFAAAWSWGELMGYLTGRPSAAQEAAVKSGAA